jgi:hypothetical protein
MISPSLLALNADHHEIGGFHIGFSIQANPDRKTLRPVTSEDLNTGSCAFSVRAGEHRAAARTHPLPHRAVAAPAEM